MFSLVSVGAYNLKYFLTDICLRLCSRK